MIAVTRACKERHAALVAAKSRCGSLSEQLSALLTWLADIEQRAAQELTSQLPRNITIEQIHAELETVRRFKREVDTKSAERDAVLRSASEVIDGATAEQATQVRAPLQELDRRWNALTSLLNEHQSRLERALLDMGQFQQAHEQLCDWFAHTERMLNEVNTDAGDVKAVEIELARVNVIENDIG